MDDFIMYKRSRSYDTVTELLITIGKNGMIYFSKPILSKVKKKYVQVGYSKSRHAIRFIFVDSKMDSFSVSASRYISAGAFFVASGLNPSQYKRNYKPSCEMSDGLETYVIELGEAGPRELTEAEKEAEIAKRMRINLVKK